MRADEDNPGRGEQPGLGQEPVERPSNKLDVAAPAVMLGRPSRDDARLLEDSEVVGEQVARNLEPSGQGCWRQILALQCINDTEANGIGQSRQ